MKILMVCHSFQPDSFSGIEVYVHHLARTLAPQHEIFVLHRAGDPSAPEYSYTFTEYHDVSGIRLVNNFTNLNPMEPENNPGVRRAFARILDQVQPDLVHVHHLLHLSNDLPHEARSRNIPIVASLHDYWYLCLRVQLYNPSLGPCKGPSISRCAHCFSRSRWLSFLSQKLPMRAELAVHLDSLFRNKLKCLSRYAIMDRRIRRMRETLSLYSRIIANSNHLMHRYARFGVSKDKIQVLYYGLDKERIQAFRHKRHDKIRFGYMGSIVKHKGLHILVNTFRKVPEASLSIWGDYDFNDEVREYKNSLSATENVRFMGGYTPEEIGCALSDIDVLIVPSLWEEAYGLTVDEAKLAGIPVIASKTGGIPEHLDHGKDGLLFAPGDGKGLEKIIRRFMKDDDLIRKYRPKGNEVLSLNRHAEAVNKIYSQFSHTPITEKVLSFSR